MLKKSLRDKALKEELIKDEFLGIETFGTGTFANYFKTAVPVAAALAVMLVAAGFILLKVNSIRIYKERWSDYDDCGI